MNKAEEKVSNFYNTIGWDTDDEITEDARRWEDLRDCAKEYVGKCRLRVLRHIPKTGDMILDMASGPIQYKEYLEFSRGYRKRFCVDLSLSALEQARKKIGDHGVFLHGSFFDIKLDSDQFDCAISLHTIYHIDKDKQEEAVRKLINVTKRGAPVIIVYSNPGAFNPLQKIRKQKNRLKLVFRKLRANLSRCLGVPRCSVAEKQIWNNARDQAALAGRDDAVLYFYPHPISWWRRFEDVADVEIYPWRSFDADLQKRIFPDNRLGAYMLSKLFALEERYPRFFVKHFTYPMIVLTKK